MQYLTYERYKEIGGTLEESAFKKTIERACAIIDIRTQHRLEHFLEIPLIVEVVCADLIEYIYSQQKQGAVVSRSQSAGGVSESETYGVKTNDDYLADIDRIIEPLASVYTKTGISILYRGAMS